MKYLFLFESYKKSDSILKKFGERLKKEQLEFIVNISRYDKIRNITFNWNEIKDNFIPFFTILDRRYRVVNMTISTHVGTIKSITKDNIEKDIPFPIKQIYITVRK